MQEKFNIDLTRKDAINFNNVPHLHNFMNYLFRTDKKQNWTNRLTKNNFFFKYENEKLCVFEFDEKLDVREELKKEAYSVVMPLLRNDSERELLNDIVYMVVTNKDNNKEVNGVLPLEDVQGMLKKIISFSEKRKTEVIYVAHLDQEETYVHIHSVFLEDEKGAW